MREVRRCWAWVGNVPTLVRVMANGAYRIGDVVDELDPASVTEIPTAEWLRQNEADCRELLDACHTLTHAEPDQRKSSEAWAVMRDVVDRRWRPTT